jgi:hypothetical protein
MPPYILCAVIESNEYPPLTCRYEQLEEYLPTFTGDQIEEVNIDTVVTIRFKYMTAEDYEALPEWGISWLTI